MRPPTMTALIAMLAAAPLLAAPAAIPPASGADTLRAADSVASDTLASTTASDASSELRLGASTTVPSHGIDELVPFARIEGHATSFRSPTSVIGIAAQLGVAVPLRRSSMTIPLPYGGLGVDLRFGSFSLEGRAGLLLYVPYVSAEAVVRLPLGRRQAVTLQAIGIRPMIGTGAVFLVGAGVALR